MSLVLSDHDDFLPVDAFCFQSDHFAFPAYLRMPATEALALYQSVSTFIRMKAEPFNTEHKNPRGRRMSLPRGFLWGCIPEELLVCALQVSVNLLSESISCIDSKNIVGVLAGQIQFVFLNVVESEVAESLQLGRVDVLFAFHEL